MYYQGLIAVKSTHGIAELTEVVRSAELLLRKTETTVKFFLVWKMVFHTGNQWIYMDRGTYLHAHIMKEITGGIFKRIAVKNLAVYINELEITNTIYGEMYSIPMDKKTLSTKVAGKIVKCLHSEKSINTPFENIENL